MFIFWRAVTNNVVIGTALQKIKGKETSTRPSTCEGSFPCCKKLCANNLPVQKGPFVQQLIPLGGHTSISDPACESVGFAGLVVVREGSTPSMSRL